VKTPNIVRINNNDKKPSEIQSPCLLEVNWNFLENPTFLSHGMVHELTYSCLLQFSLITL
jgi:hypothetical protein